MAKIAAANVAFGGSATGLGQAVDQAERKLRGFARTSQRLSKQVQFLGGGFLGGILGGVGISGISGIVSKFDAIGAAVDRTAKAAARVRLDVGTVRGFERLAEFSGADAGAATAGLQRMLKAIGDAKLTPATAKVFEALGTSAADLAKLPTDSAYLKILDGLRGVGRTDRVSLATAIFGKQGASLVLNQLGTANSEIERMLRLAERLGPTTAAAAGLEQQRDASAGFFGGISDQIQRAFAQYTADVNTALGSPGGIEGYSASARVGQLYRATTFGDDVLQASRGGGDLVGYLLGKIAANTTQTVPQ